MAVKTAAIFFIADEFLKRKMVGSTDRIDTRGEASRERLTAAFWFTLGLATFLVLLVSGLSIPLARFFGEPTLAPMLIVSSTKLWFVGAALVPLNQLNSATRFERIALISTLASLGSGLLTCGLAVAGYQAWSLVLGQTSHGLFNC